MIKTVSRQPPGPARIGDRYDVEGELGRGGMGVVYRVRDTASGRALALKLLSGGGEGSRAARAALFEREYHTLSQLSHPRVIEVYDYGLDDAGAYYTMELLDQGDLRERMPLPWAQACAVAYDVCSSLALLHSRRLVHRDVSPRNVRFAADGGAKLIDFGAMAPMGPCQQVVGTPPFTAPEVVHRLELDARTDLFSVGATLYSALTGRAAYPARDISQLPRAWASKPEPPSAFAAEIPHELDVLVLSLLALEPQLRPRTVFEVMQRLSAIAGLPRQEPASVSSAYLATPTIVGREEVLGGLRKRIARAARGRGRGVVIEGSRGVGRSRLLDACVLEAKLLGAVVLRAHAHGVEPTLFATAQTLAEQLLEALPEEAHATARKLGVASVLFAEPQVTDEGIDMRPRLRSFTDAGAAHSTIQAALARWVAAVARRHALVLAVDDAHSLDEASTAFLAALAYGAERRRMLLVVTLDGEQAVRGGVALELLRGRCARTVLSPLDRAQTEQMLGSAFGDVPYVGLVAEHVWKVGAGSPRESMALARDLVDRGLARYENGAWTLPTALGPADLPASALDAWRDRVAALSPLALRVAAVHALSSNAPFTREEHARMAVGASGAALDAALTELLSRQILTGDGSAYALEHELLAEHIAARLPADDARALHRALAAEHVERPRKRFTEIHHLMEAGEEAQALDRLRELLGKVADRDALYAVTDMSGPEMAAMLDRALDAVLRLPRSERERYDVRSWLMRMSVTADEAYYWKTAPTVLARLSLDSGLATWRELPEELPPGDRLSRAFTSAAERFAATPETERVCRPDEAIRDLVMYVATSIPIAARANGAALQLSLPPLLEPFVALSPLIDAIWQNAIASCDAMCRGRYELARERWIAIHGRLTGITSEQLPYVVDVRNAVAFAVGMLEARLGIATATSWADLLDDDILQHVNAMSLRQVAALQQGATDEAERYRRKAELLSVQARAPQMFSALMVELAAYVLAGDLTGVKRVGDRFEALAERHAGWVSYAHLSRAQVLRLSGDPRGALHELERTLELCTPDPEHPDSGRPILAWPAASAAKVETLVALDRYEEARAYGEGALALCAALELGVASHELSRATCLAQARLGDYAGAVARIDAVIAAQRALGVSGLYLGASYEVRARVALWSNDHAAVEQYAQLAAEAYRHGRGSALGARYERLMQEARGAGIRNLPDLSDLQNTVMATTGFGGRAALGDRVARALQAADGAGARAEQALRLLTAKRRVGSAYLFLVREEGLQCAASLSGGAPPAGLLDFAREQVEREALVSEIATSVVSDTASVATSSPSQASAYAFTDATEQRHLPLLLGCVRDGVAVVVGVAVIGTDARGRGVGALNPLATAVAAHLLGVGDVRPHGASGA